MVYFNNKGQDIWNDYHFTSDFLSTVIIMKYLMIVTFITEDTGLLYDLLRLTQLVGVPALIRSKALGLALHSEFLWH